MIIFETGNFDVNKHILSVKHVSVVEAAGATIDPNM